jgi:ABC-type transport system involved in multi-copper enzyme maturation permease subunit
MAAPALPDRSRYARAVVALTLAVGLAVGWLWVAPDPVLALPPVVMLIVLGGWCAARLAAWLGGPLLVYDLGRLARRGRSVLLRTAYVALLIGGLVLVYRERFPSQRFLSSAFDPQYLSPARRAEVGRSFVATVLLFQGLAVLILTPAYLAGAISDEKESNTLQLLFTTHLSDREIVLGKLFGRLAHLGMVLLGGLPVLMLLGLWGGVHPAVSVVGFLGAAATLLSVGSFSILCSTLCSTTFAALLASYAGVFVVSVCCLNMSADMPVSPLSFLFAVGAGPDAAITLPFGIRFSGPSPPAGPADPWTQAGGMLGVYLVIHGVISTVCSVVAVVNLRGPVTQPEGLPPPRPRRRPPSEWEETIDLLKEWREPRPVPPVDDRPLLWKEMYVGGISLAGLSPREWWHSVGRRTLAALAWGAALLAVGRILAPWLVLPLTESFLKWTLCVLLVLLLTGWCAAAGFRASTCITRESERRTLYGLLTLPVERSAVLVAKWLGALLRFRIMGYGVALVLVTGTLTGALHPFAALLLAGSGAAWLYLAASLGVWLSLVNRNTLWARMSMALALLVILAGSWVSFSLGNGGLRGWQMDPARWQDHLTEVGLNPVRTWVVMSFSWHAGNEALASGDRLFRAHMNAAAAGSILAALVAEALWLLAVYRFRRL